MIVCLFVGLFLELQEQIHGGSFSWRGFISVQINLPDIIVITIIINIIVIVCLIAFGEPRRPRRRRPRRARRARRRRPIYKL